MLRASRAARKRFTDEVLLRQPTELRCGPCWANILTSWARLTAGADALLPSPVPSDDKK